MNCKICNSETTLLGEAQVMGKHTASYRHCVQCGFVFVANPSWLAESYQSAINRTDIGTAWRAHVNSLATKAVIELLFRNSATYLDYGAGYGLFVRNMRDLGYDFHAYDRFCENIFSKDFEIRSLAGKNFDLICAHELVEHLEDPLQVFKEIFSHTDTIMFSTEIISIPPPAPGTWWYYGLDHGQHISFFSKKSLECLAATLGKHLTSNGTGLHLLSSHRVNERLFKLVIKRKISKVLDLLLGRDSLLPKDFQFLREQQFEKMGERPGKVKLT